MKILLFDAFTALSSNIGRFHEIFEFLTELKAKNIDEALDIGIYELCILATKPKTKLCWEAKFAISVEVSLK